MWRRNLYYHFKPFLPRGLRLAVRRRIALRKLAHLHDFWPILESAGATPPGWPGWPERKQVAFVLSHDVEGKVGVERVRALAELEMSFGLRSSFNFIPEGSYAVPIELRSWLVERGFEVGVHDLHHDGKLYQSRNRFTAAAQRINEYLHKWHAMGFRSGFMLHQLDWIHDLNLLYDASTFDTDPFEPQPDGTGTVFPFWVPCPNGTGAAPNASHLNRGYVELPYSLPQDSTLFLVLREKNAAIWKRKLDWIVSRGGMALMNIHPDYVSFSDGKPPAYMFSAAILREFFQYVKQTYGSQCWYALPREVASWYIASRNLQPHSMLRSQ